MNSGRLRGRARLRNCGVQRIDCGFALKFPSFDAPKDVAKRRNGRNGEDSGGAD